MKPDEETSLFTLILCKPCAGDKYGTDIERALRRSLTLWARLLIARYSINQLLKFGPKQGKGFEKFILDSVLYQFRQIIVI